MKLALRSGWQFTGPVENRPAGQTESPHDLETAVYTSDANGGRRSG
jgi:hypothetical protein